MPTNVEGLTNVAIAMLPGIFTMIRAHTARVDPSAPIPTDADVIAALNQAIASSVAQDDRWLASHPSV